MDNTNEILLKNYDKTISFLLSYLDARSNITFQKLENAKNIKEFNKYKKEILSYQKLKFETFKVRLLIKETIGGLNSGTL